LACSTAGPRTTSANASATCKIEDPIVKTNVQERNALTKKIVISFCLSSHCSLADPSGDAVTSSSGGKKRKTPAASKKGEKGKKAKKAKDPNKKKRPLSAYMNFSVATRPSVVAKNPGIAFGAVGTEIARLWHLLSDEEKAAYKSEPVEEEPAAAEEEEEPEEEEEEEEEDAEEDAEEAAGDAEEAAASGDDGKAAAEDE